jgi:hypothetical protein
MTLFLENTESLTNYINISNKIQTIPLFFIHFLPIRVVKNMDSHYRIVEIVESDHMDDAMNIIDEVEGDIKYKIVDYGKHYCSDNNNISSSLFLKDNFAKSLYHVFYSSSLLHQHGISFVPSNCPFISCDNSLPMLHEFSHSFCFSSIELSTDKYNVDNLKGYFPKKKLDNTDGVNAYISVDVFIITYLLHHDIQEVGDTEIDTITNEYTYGREKLDINSIKNAISYFRGYAIIHIIQYLFQCKYTWTYYSLCYYFILHYTELLKHFSLYDLFHSYIHSSFKERMRIYNENENENETSDVSILSAIHTSLFSHTI